MSMFSIEYNTEARLFPASQCADDGFGNLIPLRYASLCSKFYFEMGV